MSEITNNILSLIDKNITIEFMLLTYFYREHGESLRIYNNILTRSRSTIVYETHDINNIFIFERKLAYDSYKLVIKSKSTGKYLGGDRNDRVVRAIYNKEDREVIWFYFEPSKDNKYYYLRGTLETASGVGTIWRGKIASLNPSNDGTMRVRTEEEINEAELVLPLLTTDTLKNINRYYNDIILGNNSTLIANKIAYNNIILNINGIKTKIENYILEKEMEIIQHKKNIDEEINNYQIKLQINKENELKLFEEKHTKSKTQFVMEIISKEFEADVNKSIISNINYDEIFNGIKNEHLQKISALENYHQPRINEIVGKIDLEIEKINKVNGEHQSNMLRINNEHLANIKLLEDNFREEVAPINANIARINEEILKSQIDYANNVKTTQESYNKERAKLNDELEREKQNYNTLLEGYETQLKQLELDTRKLMDKMISDYNIVFTEIKDDIKKSENLLSELKANYNKDIELLSREFNILITEVVNNIKNLENETKLLLENTKNSIMEFKEKQLALVEAYKGKVEADKIRSADEMFLGIEKYKSELISFRSKQERDAILSELNKEYEVLNREKQSLINEFKATYEKIYAEKISEIQTIINFTASSLNKKISEIESVNAKITDVNESIKDLENNYQLKKSKLLNEHTLKLANDKEEYDTIYNRLKNELETQEISIRNKLRQKENELNNLTISYDNKILQNNIDVDKLRNSYNENILAYQKQLNQEIDIYLRKQAEERNSITQREIDIIIENTLLQIRDRDDKLRLLKREISFLEIEKKELEKLNNLTEDATNNQISSLSLVFLLISGLLLSSGLFYFFS